MSEYLWCTFVHVKYCTLESALESGQKARIVQIDVSAVFDRVNRQGILYKLRSVGIGSSIVVYFDRVSIKSTTARMVDGCLSKLVNFVSGVPQGSFLGSLLFLLYTSYLFSILENKLIGYAYDSTLLSVAPSPGVRVTVAESLPEP